MRFYTNVQLIGNQFLVRGVENGKRYEHRDEFFPTLFVKSKRDSKYRTLSGEPVEEVHPGTVRDCREFYKKYDEVDGFAIYGNDRYIYQYISEKYPEDEIKFDISQIKLVTLDIETTAEHGFPDVESAQEEILAITIQDYTTKDIITWGVKPFINKQKNVTYHYCPSEQELLNHFINHWMQDVPDVVTGWNVQLFDIPYICKRLNRVLGEKLMKRFSPWGLVTENEIYVKGRKQLSFDVGGLTQLDYLDLYKKFTYKAQESYRLDYIAEVELGQKKLDHSEFDTFKDFYSKFNIKQRDKLKICIDTCHVFAAGNDPFKFILDWEKEFPNTLILVHYNDSKGCLGCRKDRHEIPGLGEIGKVKMSEISEYCILNKIPLVIE